MRKPALRWEHHLGKEFVCLVLILADFRRHAGEVREERLMSFERAGRWRC